MTEKEKAPNEVEDEWMIRSCPSYDEEYEDCVSFKARFHQMFIFGKTLDCSGWKRSSINCYKWVNEHNVNAAEELVASERERRKERLSAHYANDTWTRRKAPPENWNCPLPEHLLKKYENTYLQLKSREMNGEIPPSLDNKFELCCIM